MGLVDYARSELTRAGLFDQDSDYGGMLGNAVMKLVEQFADEGHSGASASLTISLFQKVARFEPLSPLTGADDEWMEIAEQEGGKLYQNVRCPHVFKDGDAAYDASGRIFREPDGSCFTSYESRVPITFPYVPKREYVDRPASTGGSDD